MDKALFILWLGSLALMVTAIVKRKTIEKKMFWGAIILPTLIFSMFVAALPDSKSDDPKPTETQQVEPEKTQEPAEPQETVSQKNAREEAESYINYSSFSRKGLIKQLEYEGYDKADCEYAVDALNIDWNEQAALEAQSYLDYSSFSRKGLIAQLKYEGFTQAQAEYGVSKVGL